MSTEQKPYKSEQPSGLTAFEMDLVDTTMGVESVLLTGVYNAMP